jgi:hypothetical protein
MFGGNRVASLYLSASIRPAPVICARPTKNLLAARAQEVASERFVAFASGKKQVFDALKVHTQAWSHLQVSPVKGRSKSNGGSLATSLGPRPWPVRSVGHRSPGEPRCPLTSDNAVKTIQTSSGFGIRERVQETLNLLHQVVFTEGHVHFHIRLYRSHGFCRQLTSPAGNAVWNARRHTSNESQRCVCFAKETSSSVRPVASAGDDGSGEAARPDVVGGRILDR